MPTLQYLLYSVFIVAWNTSLLSIIPLSSASFITTTMEGNQLIDEQRDPFAFQNQEDALDMDPCFAFSKQGCNGEGSSRSEQSGKTTKRIALVLR